MITSNTRNKDGKMLCPCGSIIPKKGFVVSTRFYVNEIVRLYRCKATCQAKQKISLKPCDSHIKALRKIASKLRWGLTMGGSTIILTDENHNKLEEAELLLKKAIDKLEEIE